MKVPDIYLETTIFNFPFADDCPQYKSDTIRLFEEIRLGHFNPFTSEYVITELENATDDIKDLRLKLVGDYGVKVFSATKEMAHLADIYVTEGIIPARYSMDAMHIAAATVSALDFIVSLNFKHIVRRKTMIAAEIINYREGYKRVGIYSPAEVIEHG